MVELLASALLGGLGGLARGFLGVFKAMRKEQKINWAYWGITVAISMAIGTFTGTIFSFDYRLAALAGYAGTDILEGVYKAFAVQKVYVPKLKPI